MVPFFDGYEEKLEIESVEALWQNIKVKMASAGLEHCFVYDLNPPDFPFNVLRVVIPKAEFIESEMKRVGPRFIDAFKRREK